MVYWTSIKQEKPFFSTYENETYRVKHGYKELHVHNAPERRNKDFKPALYGHFRGMLNFKHSQPWAISRHLKDMFEEDHHIPIRYIKEALKGAIIGAAGGLMLHIHTSFSVFSLKKLYLQASSAPFGWKNLTIIKGIHQKPAGCGAAVFVMYQTLWDLFTRHRESLGVPDFFTHMKIGLIMCPLISTYMFGPGYAIHGLAFGTVLVWPLIFGLKTAYRNNGPHQSHVFYIDGVTQGEKDKFEFTDKIEELGAQMQLQFGYSYGAHTNFIGGKNSSS